MDIVCYHKYNFMGKWFLGALGNYTYHGNPQKTDFLSLNS